MFDRRNLMLVIMDTDGDWRGVPVRNIVHVYDFSGTITYIEFGGKLLTTSEPVYSVIERINALQGVHNAPSMSERITLITYAPTEEGE